MCVDFSFLPEKTLSSFLQLKDPVVGLSLSAIAIRRQKHMCAYCHLGLRSMSSMLKREKGKLGSTKTIRKKKTRKDIIFVVFRVPEII